MFQRSSSQILTLAHMNDHLYVDNYNYLSFLPFFQLMIGLTSYSWFSFKLKWGLASVLGSGIHYRSRFRLSSLIEVQESKWVETIQNSHPFLQTPAKSWTRSKHIVYPILMTSIARNGGRLQISYNINPHSRKDWGRGWGVKK